MLAIAKIGLRDHITQEEEKLLRPNKILEQKRMPFSVQRLENVDSFDAIWDEWCALESEIEPRTPFASPLWNKLWWKHFARNHLLTTNEFFFHTVRDADGKLLAVAPWKITYWPGFPPFQLRILTSFGADMSLTEVRGLICRPEDEKAVVKALNEYLAGADFGFDAVEWHGLRTYDALDLLEETSPLAFSHANELYILPLPPSWDALSKRLSSYARKYLRRTQEKLEEAGLKMRLDAVVEKTQVVKSMETFFALHAMRAQAKDMFPHPNKFGKTSNRSFVIELFSTLAEQNKAIVFEARIGEDIVACRLAFVLGSTVYIYYSGYAPEWQSHSVGTLMMIEIVRWSIENGFKELNLSAGRDRSKLQWRPTEHVIHGGVRFQPGYRKRFTIEFYKFLKLRRTKQRTISN